MDLLEAVSNLLEWDNDEEPFSTEKLDSLPGYLADLKEAAEGIEVFRFKAPDAIIGDLMDLREGLVRDNILDAGQHETHLDTFDRIIQMMKDTLREKEKPSEASERFRAEGYNQRVVEEDVEAQDASCDNCGVNDRAPHSTWCIGCLRDEALKASEEQDVSPGDEVHLCDRCHKNDRVEGEAHCVDCPSLQCDSCHDGDYSGGGDLDDEVEHEHKEGMVRGVKKDPVRFSVQMGLQVERNRLELARIDEHVNQGVALMEEVKELLLVKTPSAVVKLGKDVVGMQGRLRAMEHEVQQQALPRIRDLEANTCAAEERAGLQSCTHAPEQNIACHEEKIGLLGERLTAHDEELSRLGSVSNGDGIRLGRLEREIVRQEAIDVLAGRLKTLENMYSAHRQLLRHVPVGEEDVARSG